MKTKIEELEEDFENRIKESLNWSEDDIEFKKKEIVTELSNFLTTDCDLLENLQDQINNLTSEHESCLEVMRKLNTGVSHSMEVSNEI
jgi:hypothetical protein